MWGKIWWSIDIFRFNKMVYYISNYTQAGKIYVIAWMYLSAGQWCDSIDVAALSHYWWKMSPMLCDSSYKCIFQRIKLEVCFFKCEKHKFNFHDFRWFSSSSHPTPLQTIEDKQTKRGKPARIKNQITGLDFQDFQDFWLQCDWSFVVVSHTGWNFSGLAILVLLVLLVPKDYKILT